MLDFVTALIGVSFAVLAIASERARVHRHADKKSAQGDKGAARRNGVLRLYSCALRTERRRGGEVRPSSNHVRQTFSFRGLRHLRFAGEILCGRRIPRFGDAEAFRLGVSRQGFQSVCRSFPRRHFAAGAFASQVFRGHEAMSLSGRIFRVRAFVARGRFSYVRIS